MGSNDDRNIVFETDEKNIHFVTEYLLHVSVHINVSIIGMKDTCSELQIVIISIRMKHSTYFQKKKFKYK